MTGLAPQTLKVFPSVASLDCVKGFHLVGGTALSLQINHRLSEDLDFCRWVNSSSPGNAIGFREIEEELNQIFSGVHVNAHSFDQVDFRVNEVKVTFFNEIGHVVAPFSPICLGGINCAPIEIICAMKINVLFHRNKYRDYYDIYCIIKDEIVSIERAIEVGIHYVPELKRSQISNMLKSWKRFKDEKIPQLAPRYNISSKEIASFFTSILG